MSRILRSLQNAHEVRKNQQPDVSTVPSDATEPDYEQYPFAVSSYSASPPFSRIVVWFIALLVVLGAGFVLFHYQANGVGPVTVFREFLSVP